MIINVYSARVDCLEDAGLYNKLFNACPEYRRKKTERLKMPEDRRLSVGAEVLLGIAAWKRGLTGERTVVYGENGKPYFEDAPSFYFSISHSKDRVMCAVAEGEVGCDVQAIRDPGGIGKRFYTDAENAYIGSFGDEVLRRGAFFTVWTRKESVLKASGAGFPAAMKSFSVVSRGGPAETVDFGGKRYKLFDLWVEEGYRAACCVDSADPIDSVTADEIDLTKVKC